MKNVQDHAWMQRRRRQRHHQKQRQRQLRNHHRCFRRSYCIHRNLRTLRCIHRTKGLDPPEKQGLSKDESRQWGTMNVRDRASRQRQQQRRQIHRRRRRLQQQIHHCCCCCGSRRSCCSCIRRSHRSHRSHRTQAPLQQCSGEKNAQVLREEKTLLRAYFGGGSSGEGSECESDEGNVELHVGEYARSWMEWMSWKLRAVNGETITAIPLRLYTFPVPSQR